MSCQRQEHEVRAAAAHHVLGLLPEERPGLQLGEIRPDERRARTHSAGDVAPVGAIDPVGHGQRLRAHAGHEGCGVRAGVIAQHEAQGVQEIRRIEDLRPPAVEEVLWHPKRLDAPARAPDIGSVRHTKGRLLAFRFDLLVELGDGRVDLGHEFSVLDSRHHPPQGPATPLDGAEDFRQAADQFAHIGFVVGGQSQLDERFDSSRSRLPLLGISVRVEQRLGGLEAPPAEARVVFPQSSGRSREASRHFELTLGIDLGEHPAIVRSAPPRGLPGLEPQRGELISRAAQGQKEIGSGRPARMVPLAGIHPVVGHRRRVSQEHVLTVCRRDDPAVQPPQARVSAQQGEHTVLDLLEHVGLAVGSMHLHDLLRLIDGGGVVLHTELFVDLGQDAHGADLRLHPQIVIARIVPAARVEPGHGLPGLVLGQRGGTLNVAIEMVQVHWRHACIVFVTAIVPDAISIIDAHVAHLHRQEVLERRLPDVTRIDVAANTEDVGFLVSVLQAIHARGRDPTEVEREVVVAEEVAPFGRFRAYHHLPLATLPKAVEYRLGHLPVTSVELDDRDLLLFRVVAHLRHVDDRRVHPVAAGVGNDLPFQRTLGRAGGQLGADDVPAVVVLRASVQKLQGPALHRLDGQLDVRRIGRDGQVLASGKDRALDATLRVSVDRTVELAGEGAGHTVQVVALAEVLARKQLQVEAHTPDPGVRKGFLQVHDDAKAAVVRLDSHRVVELEIRVDDGVEPFAIQLRVGEAEVRGDRLGVLVHQALVELGDWLPLPGRGLQAQVAVGSGADAVLDDAHPTLVAFGIEITERHHVEPGALEVLGVVQSEWRILSFGCHRARLRRWCSRRRGGWRRPGLASGQHPTRDQPTDSAKLLHLALLPRRTSAWRSPRRSGGGC